MAQDRYFKPGGGRYAPIPGHHYFWAILIAALHIAVLTMGLLILLEVIVEAQWIIDKWPYPTPGWRGSPLPTGFKP